MSKNRPDEVTKKFILDFIELMKGNINDQIFYERWSLIEEEKKKRTRKKKKSETKTELEMQLENIEKLLQEIRLFVEGLNARGS